MLPPIFVIAFAMLSVALFSAFERKMMGYVQNRVGPEKVSLLGMFQPFADALKLIWKEEKSMENVKGLFFYLPPCLMMLVSVLMWWLFPSKAGLFSWEKSAFFLLLLFSVSVYGVIVMGWFSSSKYAALGCVRSTVQAISYEVGVALSIVFLSLVYFSPNIEGWSSFQGDVFGVFWMPWVFFTVLFILLVEVNRSPFDLSEGESELVSGFCVEYGGVGYTLIFLSENLSLIWVGILVTEMFLGGSLLSLCFFLVFCVWVRASFPRIRFDSLMSFFWSKLLPFFLGVVGVYLSFF